MPSRIFVVLFYYSSFSSIEVVITNFSEQREHSETIEVFPSSDVTSSQSPKSWPRGSVVSVYVSE